ncbi:hypothetical protein, conserved [Eimeria praecox]|uniref:Uncharacterized protein n=1 Tax=Eimeria praecox TaxID=51316 RepID=U6G4E3_9EIME|nr:hypothetical protein, conserved [Eimeria praecox]
MQVLQVEVLCAGVPSLCLRFEEDGSVAVVEQWPQQQQQEQQKPSEVFAISCTVMLLGVSLNSKTQSLRAAMEALVADYVRGAVGCIGSSLEEVWSADSSKCASLVRLQQRQLLTLQQEPQLLLQQRQAHGAAIVLAEFAAAAGVEEDDERVCTEFLFGHEGKWGALSGLSVTSCCGGGAPTAAAAKGAAACKSRKDCWLQQQQQEGEYWKALISFVRTQKLTLESANSPCSSMLQQQQQAAAAGEEA